MQTVHDPTISSYYVNDELYRNLVENFSDWQRKELAIAVSFDDRRRMEDRIYRLRTGYAWSQAPKSRTVRMISNVEVFATSESAVRMVRSNFLISEFRVDGTRFLSGWCGHRFVERAGRWEIQVRQVNLIDCDRNLRNPSIVL